MYDDPYPFVTWALRAIINCAGGHRPATEGAAKKDLQWQVMAGV
jgi:hypothetical protein